MINLDGVGANCLHSIGIAICLMVAVALIGNSCGNNFPR
jgi:hypothetical protein